MTRLKFHPDRENNALDRCCAEGRVNMIKERFPDMIKDFRAERILDVGAGKGNFIRACLDNGLDAYGIDVRGIYKNGRKRFLLADARMLPFRSGRFDLIFEHNLFSDLVDFQNLPESEVEKVVKEMHRVLRRSGFLYSMLGWNNLSEYPNMFKLETNYGREMLYRKIGQLP